MIEPNVDKDDNDHSMEYEIPPSNDYKVSIWLKMLYITLPIWGVIAFYLYWNGSAGWLDRGYWHELQEAANTTYPFINHS